MVTKLKNNSFFCTCVFETDFHQSRRNGFILTGSKADLYCPALIFAEALEWPFNTIHQWVHSFGPEHVETFPLTLQGTFSKTLEITSNFNIHILYMGICVPKSLMKVSKFRSGAYLQDHVKRHRRLHRKPQRLSAHFPD